MIALVANQTLPVKFRIETGIVGSIVVEPAEATIEVGETQQFTATLYDLHGEPLVGPAVVWSSDNDEIADVDGDGLATGEDAGEVTIKASVGPVSGTAELVVIGSQVEPSWNPLGEGLNDEVLALRVYDGDLIAGGGFTTADGNVANRIARWDGSQWHAMGEGFDDRLVWALTEHDGDLIAGGEFTTADGNVVNRVARWDGTAWQPMGEGLNGAVSSFTVYDGELIVGGTFTTTGSGQTANRVARWDGSAWQTVGTGLDGSVWTLTIYEGDLIVGGTFTTTGSGQTANRVARWDGTAWQPMGEGMNGSVSSFTVYDGDLIIGGSMTEVGGQAANGLARWDGTAWQPMVSLDSIGSLWVHGDMLYATSAWNPIHLNKWDGTAWQVVVEVNGWLYPMTTYADGLIMGGGFDKVDGVLANNIAQWGTP